MSVFAWVIQKRAHKVSVIAELGAPNSCQQRGSAGLELLAAYAVGKKDRVERRTGLGWVGSKDRDRAGCNLVEGSVGSAVRGRDK